MNSKYLIIVTFLIILTVEVNGKNDDEYENSFRCGTEYCDNNKAICRGGQFCQCDPDYWYKEDDYVKCRYKKRKQSLYLILELIPSFGVGHIYARRYVLGILKCIYWLISWTLFIFMRIFSDYTNKYSEKALKYAFLSCIFSIGMIIWWIIDFMMILVGRYRDGNNVELIPFWDYLEYPDINKNENSQSSR